MMPKPMTPETEDGRTLNEPAKLEIFVADEQSVLAIDPERIRLAIERILAEASIAQAEISVAVVDDSTIHELNRRYLEHDYATDVLSFVLEQTPDRLEGQIVVSAETARDEAAGYGWPADDELLLYVIHGALHLVGFDDTTPDARARMREQERRALAQFGLSPHWENLSSDDRVEPEGPVS